MTQPAEVKVLKRGNNTALLELTIHEGKIVKFAGCVKQLRSGNKIKRSKWDF